MFSNSSISRRFSSIFLALCPHKRLRILWSCLCPMDRRQLGTEGNWVSRASIVWCMTLRRCGRNVKPPRRGLHAIQMGQSRWSNLILLLVGHRYLCGTSGKAPSMISSCLRETFWLELNLPGENFSKVTVRNLKSKFSVRFIFNTFSSHDSKKISPKKSRCASLKQQSKSF